MERIKAWISEHPYLASALGITLIVGLYLILHSGSSSSAASQSVSANPGGLSDAAYTAQLAAGAQAGQTAATLSAQQGQTAAALQANINAASVANNQTSAALQLGLQQTLTGGETADYTAAAQLSGLQAQYGAANSEAITNANAGVAEATINTGGAVQVAGIQAQVAEGNTAAQLQLGLDQNQTSVNLAGISLQEVQSNNQTSMQNTLINDQSAGAITALNDSTAASIAQTNAGVQLTSIQTAGAVASQQIQGQNQQVADSFALAQQQQNNQQQDFTGVSEYGGNYSSNQATILAAVAGQPSVAVAIQGSSAAQAQSSNSLLATIVNGAFGTAKTVAAAAA